MISHCTHREAEFGCQACVERVRRAIPAFPLQADKAPPGPRTIPWSVADKAWSAYAAAVGTGQSVERIAERAGFSWGEMDRYFPGWREATDEWIAMTARVAGLERDCARLMATAEQADARLAELQRERDEALLRAEAAEDEAIQLKAVLATAQHGVAQMDAALRVWIPEIEARLSSTCVWCGTPAPDASSTEAMRVYVSEHVKACPTHPMRALEADNAALLQEAKRASHHWKTMAEMEAGDPGPIHRADCAHCAIVNAPRPGAALLAEHARALKLAVADGMRRAENLILHRMHIDPDEGLPSIRARIIAMRLDAEGSS